ncbi:hypothetical protein [Actinoplanes siamensis]|nr:hypothetical protein [Actinoplanes siamensis]
MGAHLERLMLSPTRASIPVTLAQATADVTAAAGAYRSARYGVVAAALPDLLAGLHATAAHSTGRTRDTVAGLLARAYQLASNVATKHGDDAIALTMADRARAEAAMSRADGQVKGPSMWRRQPLRIHGTLAGSSSPVAFVTRQPASLHHALPLPPRPRK